MYQNRLILIRFEIIKNGKAGINYCHSMNHQDSTFMKIIDYLILD